MTASVRGPRVVLLVAGTQRPAASSNVAKPPRPTEETHATGSRRTTSGITSRERKCESDIGILNSALGAELEGIAAYQVGAQSGLPQKPVLDLAVTFQGHHKEGAGP